MKRQKPMQFGTETWAFATLKRDVETVYQDAVDGRPRARYRLPRRGDLPRYGASGTPTWRSLLASAQARARAEKALRTARALMQLAGR